ncbi:hypothetical protein BKA70DRAFT_1242810 [Coprinopsis sp. MPI-PUGE-AT-0042]|nr:hypothetical protein BKA70DRAFT_1242810 [Coprinopsis sp. MPI-PUGE-AT-0042]
MPPVEAMKDDGAITPGYAQPGATKWLFNDLRQLAISHLSPIDMDAIDRICLGKEYRVPEWLLEGYKQVVNRLSIPINGSVWNQSRREKNQIQGRPIAQREIQRAQSLLLVHRSQTIMRNLGSWKARKKPRKPIKAAARYKIIPPLCKKPNRCKKCDLTSLRTLQGAYKAGKIVSPGMQGGKIIL